MTIHSLVFGRRVLSLARGFGILRKAAATALPVRRALALVTVWVALAGAVQCRAQSAPAGGAQIPPELAQRVTDAPEVFEAMEAEVRAEVLSAWSAAGLDQNKKQRIAAAVNTWNSNRPPGWTTSMFTSIGAPAAAWGASRLLGGVRIIGGVASRLFWPVTLAAGGASIYGMYYMNEANKTLKAELQTIRQSAPTAPATPAGNTTANRAAPATNEATFSMAVSEGGENMASYSMAVDDPGLASGYSALPPPTEFPTALPTVGAGGGGAAPTVQPAFGPAFGPADPAFAGGLPPSPSKGGRPAVAPGGVNLLRITDGD